jgi:hypothetical protein
MSKLTPEETEIRMHAFLTSLFVELETTIRQAVNAPNHIALWLRRYMTDQQTFSSPNPKRNKFYENVVQRAVVRPLGFYLQNYCSW